MAIEQHVKYALEAVLNCHAAGARRERLHGFVIVMGAHSSWKVFAASYSRTGSVALTSLLNSASNSVVISEEIK